MCAEPAWFNHGTLAVVIPCQNLDKLGLVLGSEQQRGLQHLQEWHVQHPIGVAIAEAPVGSSNGKGLKAMVLLVMSLQPVQVGGDPRVCSIRPVWACHLPPGHVIHLQRNRLKIDLHVIEHGDNRKAIVPIVVRPAKPLDKLGLGLPEDVVVHCVVHHDGHTHASCLKLVDDEIHDAIPTGELVVNPQAVNSAGLHEVELLSDHLALVLIVEAQKALVVRVALAPMVVDAGRFDAQEPRHVVYDILCSCVSSGSWAVTKDWPSQADGVVPRGSCSDAFGAGPHLAMASAILHALADRQLHAPLLATAQRVGLRHREIPR
mmetsp:Transcript_60818/g.113722  ORF Transcript_60818/g.113722 Transcript_60818/m.113722 type:complete len:319 (+) Transcript_60818:724-1680(+)